MVQRLPFPVFFSSEDDIALNRTFSSSLLSEPYLFFVFPTLLFFFSLSSQLGKHDTTQHNQHNTTQESRTRKIMTTDHLLFFSFFLSTFFRWGKIAEHKMHVCARALENGNITTIPFVLVNYAEFYEFGGKIEVLPTSVIRYTAYVNGQERQSTGNSAELEGLVTGLL